MDMELHLYSIKENIYLWRCNVDHITEVRYNTKLFFF